MPRKVVVTQQDDSGEDALVNTDTVEEPLPDIDVISDDDIENEEDNENTDEDEEEDEEESDETVSVIRHRGRPRRDAITITPEELKAKLEPDVLTLVNASQERDWRSNRASEDEKKAILLAGLKVEGLGASPAEVAKLFGLSYATYNNWVREQASDLLPSGHRRIRKARDEKPIRTMFRGKIAQPSERQFTISQSVMQMIIRENQEAVWDILLLGKSEGIKNAVKALLEA